MRLGEDGRVHLEELRNRERVQLHRLQEQFHVVAHDALAVEAHQLVRALHDARQDALLFLVICWDPRSSRDMFLSFRS